MTEPREAQRWFDVAVIGLAGRWPGASGPAELWRMLAAGVDAIRPFSDDELRRRGVDERRLRDPQFVKAGAVLEDGDLFAAPFFGYSPREAALMDPQHRLFLESAWEALEDAGYPPRHVPGQVGVFASCGLSSYLLLNVAGNPAVDEKDESFQAMIGSDKDFVATRVSYKLNLTGPSVTIQTGCSSSLVAVCLAVQSLLTYQCDVALAGGVAVSVRQRTGYWHQPGGIASPDGHCRPFAADAAGTVFADGVGAIVLKRLADALQDGDQIYAVVRGVAINNDGSAKVGYTAPSVAGQAEVVRRALAVANVTSDSISYVEAHGTATALGDPAEIAALTEAFGAGARPACAIGSVKGNIGHLDAAAGITGLVKTILMLKHGALVPSLHFGAPNPRIDFARSPFYVNTTLTDWTAAGGPRRAGVSSFGIGGTNAHVILEEAPEPARTGTPRATQILTLSAESGAALEAATDRLASWLADTPGAGLADVAFTCQMGRETFRHRRAVVCDDVAQAAGRLRARDRDFVYSGTVAGTAPPVVLMFPGGGAQYVGMGRDLYALEAVFRAAVDRCAESLARIAPVDLRRAMYSTDTSGEAASLDRLAVALPAIFTTSYAMVQLLASWGVRPAAMIGHSLGEYVAACVAGVLSLEDAIGVVALRGRLLDEVPAGAMLSVYASRQAIEALELPDVCIAAVNAPDNCVIAGPADRIAHAEAALAARGLELRRLRINAAAHSAAVEPVVEPLGAHLRAIPLHPPAIPYISNLTGTWITPAEAVDPDRWVRHLRQPVEFAAGIAELARQPLTAFVDVGPGRTIASLARAQLKPRGDRPAPPVVAMMKHAHEERSDEQALSEGAARLWTSGIDVDWRRVGGDAGRRRVSLPTYPFERQRYWLDPPSAAALAHAAQDDARGIEAWCYLPGWRRALPPRSAQPTGDGRSALWVIFADDGHAADGLCERLQHAGVSVVVIRSGARYQCVDRGRYLVDPTSADDYRAVLRAARAGACRHAIGIHLWSLAPAGTGSDRAAFANLQRTGLFSLVAFAQAASREGVQVDLLVVTTHAEQVGGGDTVVAAKTTIRAACAVLPQEVEGVRCRFVDLVAPGGEPPAGAFLADCALAECAWEDSDPVVAYRASQRWVRHFEQVRVPAAPSRGWLREGGVYLLVGGTGQIGLTLAQAFARFTRCTIVLTGRTGDRRSGPGRDAAALAHAMQAIESCGSGAVVYAANAADLTRMREVVAEVERRWGAIAGIVHLAGVTGAAALQPVAELAVEDYDVQFEPKVGGACVLRELLDGRAPDFCVTFSSTASMLGGVGLLPYAAANTFLDGLAATMARDPRSPRWISINWDGWLTPEAVHGGHSVLARHAMQPADAIEVLDRLLSSAVCGQVVVSTGDLQARIVEWTSPRPAPEPVAVSQPRPALVSDYVAPETPLERTIAEVWSRVLGVTGVGVHDNLFELGGNSLIALRLVAQLKQALGAAVAVTTLFEAPTVHLLARRLSREPGDGERRTTPAPPAVDQTQPVPAQAAEAVTPPRHEAARDDAGGEGVRWATSVAGRSGIAIVGLAGRFPGAEHVGDFWRGLANGQEAIRRDDDGSSPGDRNRTGRFVRATAMLSDYESFDAEFFGMTPAEAALRDPQHRIFLEQAWAAVENAGYDCRRYGGRVGVFAGATTNTYLTRNIGSRPDVLASFDPVQVNVANGPDFLTTLVSYKLNLTGPSHTVQSACSTSLVALHCACRSLLNRECDMALAGGVSVNLMLAGGYRYIEGGILSADGRCRAFDADATGTVFGSGAAVVVLKRLEDAIADGDCIHAVVRGSAVNNDGGVKAGYTAPSVDGEARVIEEALRAAGTPPHTISYIECHGTGTMLGDPIEVLALTRAYGAQPGRSGACALGSVKTNVGHLDAAAGVTGLIKVVESLEHGMLVPSLHYTRANPQIDFAATPFYVNTTLKPWRSDGDVRRAGVSAFGVGGTNAHVIVEEAPAPPPPEASRPWQLLVWSGKTAAAVEAVGARLAAALREMESPVLADLAYTLQTGRQRMAWRRAVVCADAAAAAEAWEGGMADAAHDGTRPETARVVFVFPGHGVERVEMGRELYARERVYREAMDRCAAAVRDELGADLRELLYERAAPEALCETWLVQPALVATSYALAQLWMAWGVQPAAMLGHGLGEYVAASIAGVWPIETALRLVVERGRLMQALPRTATVAVEAGRDAVGRWIGEGVSIAAVDGPGACTLGGPVAAIEALERELRHAGVESTRLLPSRADHTPLMAPVVEALSAAAARVPCRRIAIPYVSSTTGTWMTDAEVQSAAYWGRHAQEPVQFGRGLETLLADGPRFVLEVGPGRRLSRLARRRGGTPAAASLAGPAESEQRAMLNALGHLWAAGVDIDWGGFYAGERRRRVPLPSYPFQRTRHWIDPATVPLAEPPATAIPVAARTLAAPEHAPHRGVRPSLRNAYVAPRDATERAVVDIVEAALGIHPVGVTDRFGELGGDSLQAVRIIDAINARLHVHLRVVDLYDDATVRDVAARLSGEVEPPHEPALPTATGPVSRRSR